MSTHDAAGTELVPAKRRNLPLRILRAIDAAMHVAGLPRRLRSTLAEISRYVSQREPLASIFPKKESIAQRLGVDPCTVHRHLKDLVGLDLIAIGEQERKSRNGRFAIARIRLTVRGATLLGLIDADPCAEEPAEEGDNSAEKPVVHTPPSCKTPAGHTLSVPTGTKTQPVPRYRNGLPADLSWLTGKGMHRSGVFALMGMAKAEGKRLSDIVIAMETSLLDKTGRQLYAYLAALCRSKTDFAYAASQVRKSAAEASARAALSRKSAIFRQRFAGVCLIDREGETLFAIDKQAAFVQMTGKRCGSAPLTDLKQWIDAVESGQMVLATLAAERALAAR